MEAERAQPSSRLVESRRNAHSVLRRDGYMPGLLRELADRHVFDHAPTQRAYRLFGHGDAPVLSEGCRPLISRQDAPPRYPVPLAPATSSLPRERFSPLAHGGSHPGRPARPLTEVNPPCRRLGRLVSLWKPCVGAARIT